MVLEIHCPLCKNGCVQAFSKGGFDFYRCGTCGFLFVYPAPGAERLKEYYQKEYYDLDDERYNPSGRAALEKWQRRLSVIQCLSPGAGNPQTGRSILDVGCATGIFLRAAQQSGWDSYGIEHADYAAERAEGLIGPGRVFMGSIQDYQSERRFTVVTSWAMIEHISDPMLFLQKAHALLGENGLLGLSTVNLSAFNYSLFKEHWRYITPPEHLSYFQTKNLSMALERVGFEIVHTETRFVYRAFLDGIYRRDKQTSQRISSAWKAMLFPVKWMTESTGRGDTLEIWARKR